MSDVEEDSGELLRQQRRIRRKLKKEEKRKENESKRLNFNPKDTHVTIVQRNFANSLTPTIRQNNGQETMPVANLWREDFPCLGQRVQYRSRSQNSNISENLNSQSSNSSEPNLILSRLPETMNKEPVKVKKSKAPVILNLEDMIKAEPNPFIATLKQNMSINTEKSIPPKDKLIAGGKQREIPKPRRPNTFKTAILKERENDKDVIPSMDIICDNVLSEELDSKVSVLLNEIVTFQEKLYKRNPIKGSSKRRYVAGFHEVKKLVCVGKIRLIIFAPNLNITTENSVLVQTVNELKTLTNVHDSQYVFALSRRKLGRLVLKSVPVSCIGILNYSGAENTYKQVLELMEKAKQEFQMVKVTEKDDDKSITDELSKKLLNVLKLP